MSKSYSRPRPTVKASPSPPAASPFHVNKFQPKVEPPLFVNDFTVPKGDGGQTEIVAMANWLLGRCVIIDTETTGLADDDEVIQIAVTSPVSRRYTAEEMALPLRERPLLDMAPAVILKLNCKPRVRIHPEAYGVHGITDEELVDAPRWSEILPQVLDAVGSNHVVAYNAEFDARLISQTSRSHLTRMPEWNWYCLMKAYAKYHASRWMKLKAACEKEGIEHLAHEAHDAGYDTIITGRLLKALAGK